MRKITKTVMEMNNVSFVQKPHALLTFNRAGFSLDDIVIRRVDSVHYDMVAQRRTIL